MRAYKVGQVFYRVSWDEDDNLKPSNFEMTEWVIRSIRVGTVHATMKATGATWVKVSKKHGDWGWAPSIPKYFKRSWRETGEPYGLVATKAEAWKMARIEVFKWAEPEYQEAALKTIGRMISRCSNKAKK